MLIYIDPKGYVNLRPQILEFDGNLTLLISISHLSCNSKKLLAQVILVNTIRATFKNHLWPATIQTLFSPAAQLKPIYADWVSRILRLELKMGKVTLSPEEMISTWSHCVTTISTFTSCWQLLAALLSEKFSITNPTRSGRWGKRLALLALSIL